MDVNVLFGFFALMITVIGGLLGVVWRQMGKNNDFIVKVSESQKDHELKVATEYVSVSRLESEIGSVKELLERVEKNISSLLEMNARNAA